MLPHDKSLALSAVEAEQLRDLRSRLNRLPPNPALAARSIGPLSRGFFELCMRIGFVGAAGLSIADSAKALASQAEQAGPCELRALVGSLEQLHRTGAPRWSEIVTGGVLQAVISRRLALAGREPAKEGVLV
jgi:hypothetical protein